MKVQGVFVGVLGTLLRNVIPFVAQIAGALIVFAVHIASEFAIAIAIFTAGCAVDGGDVLNALKLLSIKLKTTVALTTRRVRIASGTGEKEFTDAHRVTICCTVERRTG